MGAKIINLFGLGQFVEVFLHFASIKVFIYLFWGSGPYGRHDYTAR